MSCRTTSAGSAFTTYARLANGSRLSDVATLSTFHYLRHNYSGRSEDARRVYTEEEYRALLNRQIERTNQNSTISDARRASILTRLNQALTEPMPDQATCYALFNLNPTVRERGNSINTLINRMYEESGRSITREDLRELYDGYENEIEQARNSGNPETYTEENIEQARTLGLATNAASVHAATMLRQRAIRARTEQALAQPQRVERQSISSDEVLGNSITEMGYDPRNGRLEVTLTNSRTNETRNYTYRNVPAEQYASMLNGDGRRATNSWWDNVRGNDSYAYANDLEAALDSVAPRCPVCGQFANTSHGCPSIGEPRRVYDGNTRSRWSRATTTVINPENGVESQMRYRMPAVREFREMMNEGPVRLSINDYVDPSGYVSGGLRWARLNGDVTIYRNESNELSFNLSQLRCSCGQFSSDNTTPCSHIRGYQSAILERLQVQARAARATMTPEERAADRIARAAEAQAAYETAAALDWTRNEESLADAKKTWRTDSEVLFSEDFTAYETARNKAIAERAAKDGGVAVPYMKENVLDGMATRESGQGFGMEIEYEFPTDMQPSQRREANRRIGEALYAAKIFSTERQQGYHAAGRNGYSDVHINPETDTGTWSFESDSTVNGGEIVSPLMYDEPETWENLQKVVSILRENGAVSSKKAGAHVHVGTGMYQGDAKKYTELARMMKQHEDVMMRLASDPNRGSHRGTRWAAPSPAVPENGFSDVAGLRTWQGGRYRLLNFTGVTTSTNVDDSARDHPEFRLFDSTLDAGTMQTQVKLAVAMTHAAARNAESGGTKREAEPVGSHAKRVKTFGRRALTTEQLQEDTATFRSFMDTLFKRKEDKEQVVALFEHTKWAKA